MSHNSPLLTAQFLEPAKQNVTTTSENNPSFIHSLIRQTLTKEITKPPCEAFLINVQNSFS